MKRDSKECVAFHEAGHALAHFVYDMSFRRVSIIRDGDSLGHVLGRSLSRQMTDFVETVSTWTDRETSAKIARFHDHVVCLMAGAEAERLFANNRFISAGAGSDFRKVNEILYRLHSSAEWPLVFKWLKVRAKELVARPVHMHCIRALAKELTDKGQLSGKCAQSVIRESFDNFYAKKQRKLGLRSLK